MFCFLLLQRSFYRSCGFMCSKIKQVRDATALQGCCIIYFMFHVQQNKINAVTILQALAGLLRHALILFYCT